MYKKNTKILGLVKSKGKGFSLWSNVIMKISRAFILLSRFNFLGFKKSKKSKTFE